MTLPNPLQYDSFAAGFDLHARESTYNSLYDRPAMLDLIGDVEGRRVLDAGCGPGLYLEELARRGATLIACDSSPAMVKLAAARVPAADVRVHSLERPMDWLPDDSIDLVVNALVLHHLSDRVGFLRECRRVLRADGALVVSTVHPTTDWLRAGGSYFDVETVTETWQEGWNVTAWRMPLSSLVGEFRDAGLTIDQLVEPRPVPEMEGLDPRRFGLLSKSPGFIMFRLVAEDR